MGSKIELGENLSWIIYMVMIFGALVFVEYTNPGSIIDKELKEEPCVVLSIEKKNALKGFKNTAKVKFCDGIVEIKKIEDHLSVGDTILIER